MLPRAPRVRRQKTSARSNASAVSGLPPAATAYSGPSSFSWKGRCFCLLPSHVPDSLPSLRGSWDNQTMTGQDQDTPKDGGRHRDSDWWAEFDNLGPAAPDRVPGQPGGEPMGFGFRTGVRSSRVAVGFAVYALALGTILALTGCIVFAAQGQWLLVALMLLIEAAFVFGFSRLVAQARHRAP